MESFDKARLNQCLTSIIEKIDTVLKELDKKPETALKSDFSKTITTAKTTATTTIVPTDEPFFDNTVKNNIVNTFTIDNEEFELLDTLTHDIQNILRNSLSQLSNKCASYIKQHLHQYHFNQDQVFTQALAASILYTFKHDLNGLLLAARAYPAAFNGDIKTVDNFLKRYPMYKDKPGFWKTTLIHSAARNNHLRLVQYLIETAGCSVNAQNQSEIAYILIADGATAQNQQGTLDYKPDPTAAATALHAACFNNNLNIVKYLISKGANYFIRNQRGETPIQNSMGHQAIHDFFKDYLVSTYTILPYASLPNDTILKCYDRRLNDCIWEYKPVNGFEWEEFTISEHVTLCNALRPGSNNQSFNTTTYLSARQSTYNVELLTFLRGSKNQDPNPSNKDGLAWIRCRGSSIANFDIHCVWQLMFVKYNTKKQSQAASLEPPSDKTILGFIRWIPKLIANTPNDQNSIKILDNFKMINNFNPIPLTTKRLEQYNGSKSTMVGSMTTTEDNENEEINPMTDLRITIKGVDDDDDDDNSAYSTSSITNLDTWSITDLLSTDFQSTCEHHKNRGSSSNASKTSPFYDACRENNISLVEHYLKTMTLEEVNRMEPNGSTALHVAAYRGHEKIVELLLQKGASYSAINKFNNTPLDEARTDKIRQLIRRRMNHKRFVSDSVEWILQTNDADYQAHEYFKKLESYGKDRHFYKLIDYIKKNYLEQELQDIDGINTIKQYFEKAIDEKDPTYLLTAYTAETDFYTTLNVDLAKLQLQNLTAKENLSRAYYIGIIACHPKFETLSYIGKVYRGMMITGNYVKK
ncbi:unnamed protein product [Rotaria sp. Silwood1]|nr:unnamed protein product [Rotaria sp. Silwood1]CAF4730819.1 unnamed protein product [Rotaria sp. Silwood1]CAF4951326.1 unnamed protein product [Rotaria sp. Silwood1]